MTLNTSTTPTQGTIIRRAIEKRFSEVHISFPAKVVSYNPGDATVEAEPMIVPSVRGEDNIRELDTLPILPDVPVCFPRGGGCGILLPIQPGDYVLICVSSRDLGTWLETGSASDPGIDTAYPLSGAVAIPGVFPTDQSFGDASDSNMVIGEDGGTQIVIQPGGDVNINPNGTNTNISGGADFVALAQKVLTELTKIQVAFDAHTHAGVTPGPSNTGPAAPLIGTLSPVAASKTKAT